MDTIKKKKMLVQPNSITEAHYSVSLPEKQILLMALGNLNTNLVHTSDDIVTVSLRQLHEKTQSTMRFDKYVVKFKSALDSLSKKLLVIHHDKMVSKMPWLSLVREYDDDEDKLSFSLNEKVADLFSQIKGNYTQYKLLNAYLLDSVYAVRLYEMALQYKPSYQEIPVITIDELKARMELTEKYTSYTDLKRYVLEPAVKDINEKTDIKLSYKVTRKGKKAHSLKFTYHFVTPELELDYKTKPENHYLNKVKTKSVDPKKAEQRFFTSAKTTKTPGDILMEKKMRELGYANG